MLFDKSLLLLEIASGTRKPLVHSPSKVESHDLRVISEIKVCPYSGERKPVWGL